MKTTFGKIKTAMWMPLILWHNTKILSFLLQGMVVMTTENLNVRELRMGLKRGAIADSANASSVTSSWDLHNNT